MVVTAPACQIRDLTWLQRNLSEDANVTITDITDSEAVLPLMGPKARNILQSVTNSDVSNERFPFANWQEIEIGSVSVRAHRITYVGELGWELYIPCQSAVQVFDALVQAGRRTRLETMRIACP